MTPPLPPSQNIGPFYQGMGLLILAGAIGLGALGIIKGFSPWVLGGIVVAFIVLLLAVIRPPAFDALVRNVASWLPFTKYGNGRAT